uniref:Uncharacterized protein n=1 Tax=Populus trichocarpa TaxID=3694 RepID=A0A2K2B429_POPTR
MIVISSFLPRGILHYKCSYKWKAMFILQILLMHRCSLICKLNCQSCNLMSWFALTSVNLLSFCSVS